MQLIMNLLPLAKETMPAGEVFSTSITGIVVVILVLGLLALIVQQLSKIVRAVENLGVKKQSKEETVPMESAPIAAPVAVQTIAAPKLMDVDDKTAAVVMAAVSHETNIPLNRLEFKSIKKI